MCNPLAGLALHPSFGLAFTPLADTTRWGSVRSLLEIVMTLFGLDEKDSPVVLAAGFGLAFVFGLIVAENALPYLLSFIGDGMVMDAYACRPGK